MIVRRAGIARTVMVVVVAVVVADRAMAVVVIMAAALAAVAAAHPVVMEVVPPPVVVAPSAAVAVLATVVVAVIRSGNPHRPVRKPAAERPTATRADVPAMVMAPGMATVIASRVMRKGMTRDVVRVTAPEAALPATVVPVP
jgi:hypothetical protein